MAVSGRPALTRAQTSTGTVVLTVATVVAPVSVEGTVETVPVGPTVTRVSLSTGLTRPPVEVVIGLTTVSIEVTPDSVSGRLSLYIYLPFNVIFGKYNFY